MAYFRIYLTNDNRVAIVQMTECDEIDYSQNMFLSDNRFEKESEAIEYLQENESSLPSSINNPYASNIRGIWD